MRAAGRHHAEPMDLDGEEFEGEESSHSAGDNSQPSDVLRLVSREAMGILGLPEGEFPKVSQNGFDGYAVASSKIGAGAKTFMVLTPNVVKQISKGALTSDDGLSSATPARGRSHLSSQEHPDAPLRFPFEQVSPSRFSNKVALIKVEFRAEACYY